MTPVDEPQAPVAPPVLAVARGARQRPFALIGAGALARLGSSVIGVVAGVLTVSLAIRLLGLSSYGALAFAVSTASLVAGVVRLGLDPGVARTVASLHTTGERDGVEKAVRGAVTLTLIGGAVGACALCAVFAFAPAGLDTGTRVLFCVSFGALLLGSNAAAVANAVARGHGRMVLMEAPLLVPLLAKLGGIALLYGLAVNQLRWAAVAYGAAGVLGVAASGLLVRSVFPRRARLFRPDLSSARSFFVVAAPFAITGLSTIVISRFDVLILGLTGTSVQVGFYEPTLKLVEQGMSTAPLLFTAPFLPAATRLFASGDAPLFRELYFGVSKLVYVCSLPVLLILVAFPERVLHTLFGESFPAQPRLVWLLLVGYVVNIALGLNSGALAAAGNRRALFRYGTAGFATMIVLACALIPPFGPTGAAIATSATFVVINIVLAVALARSAGILPLRTDLAVTVASSALPVAAALALRSWGHPSSTAAAIGASLALWAAWLPLLVALRALRLAELTRLMPRRIT